MRAAALVLLLVCAARAEFVQAIDFPYAQIPRQNWERELVWLKNIGVRTVAFAVPAGWHEAGGPELDLTGRTSPRRDLAGFVGLLRRLELRAWVRNPAALKNWRGASGPPPPWLARWLSPHLAAHGGPVAWADTGLAGLPPPPRPLDVIPATAADALHRSRRVLAQGRGTVLWEGVEDGVVPGGWNAGPLFARGAVSFAGDERQPLAVMRREIWLARGWGAALGALRPASPLKIPGLKATLLRTPSGATAISALNDGPKAWTGDLRVKGEPLLAGVTVPAGEALLLPLRLSFARGGVCAGCGALANPEQLVYATAELQGIEYENGILAMEFAAPVAGEAVVQLERRPSGPYLAGGRPVAFDYDEKTFRARLPIPQGRGPGQRVRVSLAIEAPESTAFFSGPFQKLLLGRANPLTAAFSSEALSQRARLRLPPGFTVKTNRKGPLEIEYEITPAPTTPHGEFAPLAIEADGVDLTHVRAQVLKPLTIRLPDAVKLHFGDVELASDPPHWIVEAGGSRGFDLALRNHSPGIETYTVEIAAEGVEFSPPKQQVSVGAATDRVVTVRAFAAGVAPGVHRGRIRVSGAASFEMPLAVVALPRGRTLTWRADLDGDGLDEIVMESARLRAAFSPAANGRWLELVWKPAGVNLLTAAAIDIADPERAITIEDNRITVAGEAPQLAHPAVRVSRAGGVFTVEPVSAP